MTTHEKYEALQTYIKELKTLAIAYSGGVDSTFLLRVAHDVLGENVIAVTATSSTYPKREFEEAKQWIADMQAKHFVIVSEELEIEGFSENPPDRCYYCKRELMTKIIQVAKENGIAYVADGSNIDDLGDYRPGMRAAKELGILSPLKKVEMTKEDIRILSRELGLPTWDKPAFACLSSRFPYGHPITKEKLAMVEQAENYLFDLGFRQLRVRHHDDTARIELGDTEFIRFADPVLMKQVGKAFQSFGFTYVSLDLNGYRTGSMNEVLTDI